MPFRAFGFTFWLPAYQPDVECGCTATVRCAFDTYVVRSHWRIEMDELRNVKFRDKPRGPTGAAGDDSAPAHVDCLLRQIGFFT